VIFVWFWYWYCRCEIVALTRDSPRFPDHGPCLQPFLAVPGGHRKIDEKWFDLTLYRWLWPDLPNGRKISGWLLRFPGKLAVHPGVGVTQLTISKFTHLLVNNLNIVDPKYRGTAVLQSTLYFLDSWVPQQSKKRKITGTGLVQPGKSYRAVRTAEFNWRTSENPYLIASIDAPLKRAAWRSKFVIFHTCTTFFWNFLVALRRFGNPGPFPPCLIGGTPRGYPDTSLWKLFKILDMSFEL
jgi:hypothetical protein